MNQNIKILLLEDSLSDVMLLQRVLHKAEIKYVLQVVDTEADFADKLDRFVPDVVLSDHALPSFNSMQALSLVRKKGLDIPFILVTGTVSEEFAVSCMKSGADDYILKDRLFRLPLSIQTAIARKQLTHEKETIEFLHNKLKRAFRELSEKNQSILQSIRYAQRIQESMFPGEVELRRFFHRSFLLNKPKDIIGGDFCWFMEHESRFYIAVADCTGHGVPGALLSVLGFNLLNQLAHSKTKANAGEMLEFLHSGIQQILRQDLPANLAHDGMDIALCIIDRKRKKIEFSGANRPLYFSEKTGFKVIKGMKRGIGGQESRSHKPYINHTIPYKKGDMMYLSTDGYADQFGGKKGRKLMNRNLNKLLQSSHSFDILEQGHLFKEWFEKWKGELEQTDDILVTGIEL
jgi:serine phosphatase RsbU (regulator of sigma subunit)